MQSFPNIVLGDVHMWLVLLAVAISGIVGGIARKITAEQGSTENMLTDGFIGAVTALAMMFVIPGDTAGIRVLALSIVSGYTGKTLLDALRARAQLIVSQEQTKQAAKAGLAAVDQARAASAKLVPADAKSLSFAIPGVDMHALDEIEKQLRAHL
jgi:hypothetical protein